MNNEKIKEYEKYLKEISTPTGLSYSGDQTLSNDDVDEIISYMKNLLKEKEEMVQYACDLEDNICNLNGKISKLQKKNKRANQYINFYEDLIQKYENLTKKLVDGYSLKNEGETE